MKEKKMDEFSKEKSFEKNKLDLIKLRIKNGYYDKSDILDRVVDEIFRKEIRSAKK